MEPVALSAALLKSFKGNAHVTKFRIVGDRSGFPLASIFLVARGCWTSHKVPVGGQETDLFLEQLPRPWLHSLSLDRLLKCRTSVRPTGREADKIFS